MKPVERIRQGLVVSCQAWPDSPLYGPQYMAAMAQAAAKGGAAGIRANGVDDITAIAKALRQGVPLPIIGIQKSYDPAGSLWITATFEEAAAVAGAGADIIAVDSRRAERPDGTHLRDLFERVHAELGLPVMADIATFGEALQAQEMPDFNLLQYLVQELVVPVVAEGLYWTPSQVCRAFELGAHSVVVGTAITRPDEITRRFVDAMHTHFSGS
jgi:N-acylglucosamine-6-phosphate 2-epimerase